MSWDASFEEPICKLLTTLRDAEYIASLPAKIHAQPKWQTAMSALIAAADGGPECLRALASCRPLCRKLGPLTVQSADQFSGKQRCS